MARASSAKCWPRGRPRRRSHGPMRQSIVRITGSSSASRSDASSGRFGERRGLMRRTLATCGRPLACPATRRRRRRDTTAATKKGRAVPDASKTATRSDARPSRARNRAPLGVGRAVILGVAVIVGFVACGGGGGGDSGKANGAKTPTATSLPVGYTLAAQAKGPELGIYDNPSAPAPAKTVPNPWLLNNEADKKIPQVFLVEQQRSDWVKVLLPDRPNGSTGWVRRSED